MAGAAVRLLVTGTLVVSGAVAAAQAAQAVPTRPVPTISSLQPTAASTVGYTPVIISGAHLGGTTKVTFGSKPARDVDVLNASHVEAFAPPHGHGRVTVRVLTAHKTSRGRSFNYTYVPPLTWASSKSPLTTASPAYRDVDLTAISCPNAVYCVSVGEQQQDDPSAKAPAPAAGTTGPVIETRSGGTSRTVFAPLPPGTTEAARETAQLDQVTCTSSTFCAAEGTYRPGAPSSAAVGLLLLTMTRGVWSVTVGDPPAALAPGFEGIGGDTGLSCGADGSCVVGTGDYERPPADGAYQLDPVAYVLKDGTWTATELPVPSGTGSGVRAVSCASADSCLLAEHTSPRTYLARYDGTSWTASVLAPPKGQAATDYQPIVLGIGCSTAQRCTLATVSFYGAGKVGATSLVALTGTTPTYHAIPLPADRSEAVSGYTAESPDGAAQLSCPSAGVCFLSDTYAEALTASTRVARSVVARLDGSSVRVWRMPESVAPGRHRTVLSGLDCPSVSFCGAVGHRGGASAASAVHVIFANGVWQAGTLKQTYVSSKDATYVLDDVSCAAVGTCLANSEVRWDYTLDQDDVFAPRRLLGVTATATRH